MLIVPPGVIHGWADIPDHVDYLSFRPSHGVMKNGWVNPTIASNAFNVLSQEGPQCAGGR